jgi:hypothetical protein
MLASPRTAQPSDAADHSAPCINFPEPPRIAHTKMMVFDPRTPQRIYAAIEQGALLKTEDGGPVLARKQ